uniref:Uncharacterized protein n=1 Tax=Chelonoidis abingdonii TaxID=106734 RepID=A0A8C0GEA5_CHEAB
MIQPCLYIPCLIISPGAYFIYPQAIRRPQPPKQLGLQACATAPGDTATSQPDTRVCC